MTKKVQLCLHYGTRMRDGEKERGSSDAGAPHYDVKMKEVKQRRKKTLKSSLFSLEYFFVPLSHVPVNQSVCQLRSEYMGNKNSVLYLKCYIISPLNSFLLAVFSI